ncbi:MAG: helix-turn-helix transcriptional regulator [Candidatus Thiodiazotropha sp. 6PDIVS]
MASGKNDDKRKSSEELLATLANSVKQLREERGLTQEGLGVACDIHPTVISLVERRQRNVTISTLEIIASALGVETFELLK